MEQIFFSRVPGSDWVCMTLSWRDADSNQRFRAEMGFETAGPRSASAASDVAATAERVHRHQRNRGSQVRTGLAAGGRWIRTLGPPSAATPLSDRESPLQASFPRNLGLCFAPKGFDPFAEILRAFPGKSPVPRKGPRSTPPGHAAACISENARASKRQLVSRLSKERRARQTADGRHAHHACG